MSEPNSNIKKNCRTIFPMGFGIRKIEDEVIILDFFDSSPDESDNLEIITSIAMTKTKITNLIESLQEAIDEGGSNHSDV